MNYFIVVNALLLLRFAGANPISGATSAVIIHSSDNTSNVSSSSMQSNSDTINHYCLYPPLHFPSIPDLFVELNSAINVLEAACTNHSFKHNVSGIVILA